LITNRVWQPKLQNSHSFIDVGKKDNFGEEISDNNNIHNEGLIGANNNSKVICKLNNRRKIRLTKDERKVNTIQRAIEPSRNTGVILVEGKSDKEFIYGLQSFLKAVSFRINESGGGGFPMQIQEKTLIWKPLVGPCGAGKSAIKDIVAVCKVQNIRYCCLFDDDALPEATDIGNHTFTWPGFALEGALGLKKHGGLKRGKAFDLLMKMNPFPQHLLDFLIFLQREGAIVSLSTSSKRTEL